MLKSHHRFPFSSINERKQFDWPNGKRLAIYFTISLEAFHFGDGLGCELRPSSHQPDVVNYGWRDWGLRVGIWRLLELFDALELPATPLVNSEVIDYAPSTIAAFLDRGDEIVAHGRTNSEKQGTLSESEENNLIIECRDKIKAFTGKAPKGWLSPWISESFVTPDLLQEAGFDYVLDWFFDDQPIWLKTRNDEILSIPINHELSDISAIAIRKYSHNEYCNMLFDQFDEMLRLSEKTPLVLGIALHPFIMGHPFRLAAFRETLTYMAKHRDDVFFTHPHTLFEHYSKISL